MRIQAVVFPLAAACACLGSCTMAGPLPNEAPLRSPAVDYPLPDVTTADGHPLGADGVRVEDKLREGPRLGSGGVTPADTPRSTEPFYGPPTPAAGTPPPCEALGVRAAFYRDRCPDRNGAPAEPH